MRIGAMKRQGGAGRTRALQGGASRLRPALAAALMISALVLPTQPLQALDRFDFTVKGEDKALTKALRANSLLLAQRDERLTDPQDLFAAARADYARLLGALYAEGYYSAVIHITFDGREVADIAPLNAPNTVGVAAISIDPGPRFAFSKAQIAPLAHGTELPEGFRAGQTAKAGLVEAAVDAAVLGWREEGHAKAQVARDDLIANHRDATLAADIVMAPGPELAFGPVTVKGAERMELARIIKIAGLKPGERFSQTELDRAATRLRRTGVFASVVLAEGEVLQNGGLLPIEITVTEQKRRRYSAGAEIATDDGVSLTAEWIHRNLFGGGERLTLKGAVTNIGAATSGTDYAIGVKLDRPATPSADTTASLAFDLSHEDAVDYSSDTAEFGLSFIHYYSESLTLKAGISYKYTQGSDPGGDFRYRNFSLPLGATWDRRDSTTDPKGGFYIDATAKPFLGLGTTGSGAKLTFDTRGYRSFGAEKGVTLAARIQGGAILGSTLLDTPRDDLFFSGGGGTVRGQPYQSLGVPIARNGSSDYLIGGTYMLAASVEVRTRITSSIGVVGFFDIGRIDVDGFFSDDGDWHSGAGLGLRYETGFGPIRLDVATPVGGNTGDGVQLYIGLGQSF